MMYTAGGNDMLLIERAIGLALTRSADGFSDGERAELRKIRLNLRFVIYVAGRGKG